MYDDSETPPSIEQLVEQARRTALGLSERHLDEQLAVARVRRDVAAAHGAHVSADAWQMLTLALDDVRRMRAAADAVLNEAVSPVVRPMTPEELAEVRFDDEEEAS